MNKHWKTVMELIFSHDYWICKTCGYDWLTSKGSTTKSKCDHCGEVGERQR